MSACGPQAVTCVFCMFSRMVTRVKLRAVGVDPDVLYISKFAQPNSVYCMLLVQFDWPSTISWYEQASSWNYVGSTSGGVTKRHFNRTELALRYWAAQRSLFQFAVLPLQQCSCYCAAWTLEHETIAQRQAQFSKGHTISAQDRIGASHVKEKKWFSSFGLHLLRKFKKRMYPKNA